MASGLSLPKDSAEVIWSMKLLKVGLACALIHGVLACSASSKSSIGMSCDFSNGVPIREMPLICQGR